MAFVFSAAGAEPDCIINVSFEEVGQVNCLLYGTRVLKSPGTYVPIEELQVGDLIMGLSGRSAEPDYTVVTRVITDHPREAYYSINNEVFITADHPVLVARQDTLIWCPVDQLHLGDRIRSTNGYVMVESYERRPQSAQTVYLETSNGNFIIGGPRNHYVVKSTYAAQGIQQPVRAPEFSLV